jgi:hypothetical protein
MENRPRSAFTSAREKIAAMLGLRDDDLVELSPDERHFRP